MLKRLFFPVLILFVIGMDSCTKNEVFSDIPAIEMSGKQVYKNPTEMIIDFTDGDGDIGFNEGDTLPPYNLDTTNFNKFYYDLLFYYFQKNEAGEWEEIIFDEVNYFYRLPVITPRGQNKSLKGEIKVAISLPLLRPDSIRFEVELIDKALNVSNRITTPVIYR